MKTIYRILALYKVSALYFKC